ncbi:MAG TPA: hypothetical protein DEA44_15335 [Firmicutes bacterium]|nr:hypothetical protein [Bacillota bacterium]
MVKHAVFGENKNNQLKLFTLKNITVLMNLPLHRVKSCSEFGLIMMHELIQKEGGEVDEGFKAYKKIR